MTQTASSVSFPALGSVAVVAVADQGRMSAARAAVLRTVEAFDLACSRFREDSELCAVNRAAGRPLAVSPLLLEATAAALRAARLTDGDVDPTVGQSLLALGYDHDFDELDSALVRHRQIAIVPVPGWRTIELDEERSTIRLSPGVSLDLGATAKALAADQAAAHAYAATGCGVLVGLGGDIALAGPAPAGGWRVRVTDDHRCGDDAPGQWIAVRDGGLATSSTTARRWTAGSRTYHHLIDPASGAPAQSVWRTVTVAAASCLDANIASTAAVIRGERAVPWLESMQLPSRLVGVAGAVRRVAGWPADGDDLAPGETEASQAVPA